MFLKGYPLEAKNAQKNWNQSVHILWARQASFGQLGLISDPLIVFENICFLCEKNHHIQVENGWLLRVHHTQNNTVVLFVLKDMIVWALCDKYANEQAQLLLVWHFLILVEIVQSQV